MGRRSRTMATALLAIALAVSAKIAAAQPALPSTFKSQIVHSPAGADIFVRYAGSGPVVVLIHGYAETSDSWAPIAPWDDLIKDHKLWHFSFWGPDEERLVQGRERLYLDRIWNDFSATSTQPDEATRKFYAAQYAKPGAMRAGFAHFKAFSQDAQDNQAFAHT